MIRNSRVTLRHIAETDLPLLAKVWADPVARGEFNPTKIASPHSIRKRFLDNGFASEDNEMFLVCDESDAVIGDVGHFQAKRYSTSREIGWSIHDPAKRNRGYATEAVTALVDYLFRSYPINRVECCTSTENLASIRMAQKCGFVREGVLRGLVFVAGVHVDDMVLSLLRAHWALARAAAQSV